MHPFDGLKKKTNEKAAFAGCFFDAIGNAKAFSFYNIGGIILTRIRVKEDVHGLEKCDNQQ